MQKLVLQITDLNQNIILNQNTQVLGLFKLTNAQSVNGVLNITHSKPNIYSRINIKAIVPKNSTFDLQAKVIIPQNAINTDTYLKIDTLLLHNTSKARVVPSLEILNKEVKGGHGATVGKLDSNQLHYLQSRGLSNKKATQLLINAFTYSIQNLINE